MSWATPSCISRASRRRSSAVAASRNAREQQRGVEVDGARAEPAHQLADAVLDADAGRVDPARTARRRRSRSVPASVLSGKAKTWSCSDGQADRPGLDRDVLALVDVDRGAHRLGDQRA